MKKKKVVIATILVLVFFILGLIGITYYIAHKQLSKIKHTVITKEDKQKDIDISISYDGRKTIDSQYVNILLLGIDARNPEEASRSDSIIIATIDKRHKKIKLTSLMRDMIVNMQGRGPMAGLNQDKLNHSFAYGGPLLTLQTINKNFKTDIRNYIKVDFFGFEKIIDAVGGISIDVTQPEIKVLNEYVDEVSRIEKIKPAYVTKVGKQILNGKQAVAYSRIRYVGNEDFQRTERQRTVLTQLFNKLSKLNPLELNKAVGEFLPYVETSMNESEILNLGSYIVMNKISNMEQLRLPIDGYWNATYVRNVFFLQWDVKSNLESLYKFIYEDDYDPSILQ